MIVQIIFQTQIYGKTGKQLKGQALKSMSKRLFMIHAWEGNSSNHIRIKGELKKQNEYFDFEYDIIIIQQQLLKMDLILGVVSMVKDINSIDKEYRNLNLQLKYTLQKANRMLKKLDTYEEQYIGIVVLRTRMVEGQKLTKKLDDLLNTQSIAIKDKVRLSLPLDKTKTEIISVIQNMQKMINDLKQQLTEDKLETKVQNKCQLKEGGIKRKIVQNIPKPNQVIDNKNLLSVSVQQQIDRHLDQVYEMGPTLREDQYQYSQNKMRQGFIQFKIIIRSSEQIVKILQSQELLQNRIRITQKNIPQQQILYTVARMNFQKCYSKIKAITQDIDRISTKGHFHLIFKKTGQHKKIQQHSRISSVKKIPKTRVSSSQKQEQQVFFSFPTEERNNYNFQFKLLAKKQDEGKSLYKIRGQEWIKIEQTQVEIANGQKLAAFINPKTKQPTIYFEICYEISQN